MSQYERQQQLNFKIIATLHQLAEEIEQLESECEEGGCSHLFDATMWVKAHNGVAQELPSLVEVVSKAQQALDAGDHDYIYIDDFCNNIVEELEGA